MKRQTTTEFLEKCEGVSGLLKNMAHPQRLAILCHLSNKAHTVSELVDLCEISQSATSQFLTRMKSEGLVKVKREGGFSYYEIQNDKVSSLLKAMNKIFCEPGGTK
jgi:DNA-binding transcriptional ArsR family regulator